MSGKKETPPPCCHICENTTAQKYVYIGKTLVCIYCYRQSSAAIQELERMGILSLNTQNKKQ